MTSLIPSTSAVTSALGSGSLITDPHPQLHVSERDAIRLLQLIPTGVKTAAYTAVAQDYVIADATSAALTLTLPAAPADGTLVAFKKVDASANIVTIARGGSTDVFNKAGGSTSLTLTSTNQQMTMQYVSASALWLVSDSPSMAYLNTRFAAMQTAIDNVVKVYATPELAQAAGAAGQLDNTLIVRIG